MAAQTTVGDKKNQQEEPAPKAKEQEPSGEKRDETLGELIQQVESHDKEAAEKVSGEIEEARQSLPEIEIPPDVADAGVKSPGQEAGEVVKKGPTFEAPITEEEMNKGLHQKVVGKVVNKVVVGVSGFFALATWVARMVKVAHKHTMRVVFRKSAGPVPDSESLETRRDGPPAQREGIKDAD